MIVSFSERAVADVDDIWLESAVRWGIRQADEYTHALNGAIDGLAEQPFRAPETHVGNAGIRRLLFQSHSVFYQVNQDKITVIRILHQSMDSHRHI